MKKKLTNKIFEIISNMGKYKSNKWATQNIKYQHIK